MDRRERRALIDVALSDHAIAQSDAVAAIIRKPFTSEVLSQHLGRM